MRPNKFVADVKNKSLQELEVMYKDLKDFILGSPDHEIMCNILLASIGGQIEYKKSSKNKYIIFGGIVIVSITLLFLI